MKHQRTRPFLQLTAVASLLSTLVVGCSDRSPVSVAPAVPARDAALLPMPANAMTATLDSFPESDPGSLVQRSVTTPSITAYGFYNWYQYFDLGPGHNALLSYGNFGSFPVQIAFGKPVSRVRVSGNSPTGFEMKCPTRTGEILSGRIEGYGIIIDDGNWRQISTIDLSGPGISACSFVGWTVIASITIVPEEQTRLVLSCQGDLGSGRVTRDSTVRCEARKDPSSAPDSLQILAWSFENRARTDGDVHSPIWAGKMALSGTVSVRATLGSQQPVTKNARINVVDRVWPELVIRCANPAIHVDIYSMSNYPPDGKAYGRHQLGYLDFDSMKISHAETGPNAGSFFLAEATKILPSTIHLHPALYFGTGLPTGLGPTSPGYSDWQTWYNDQNGHGSGTCGPAGVLNFRRDVERHEGLTLADDSHVGVANRSFTEDHFQQRFERIVSQNDTGDVKFRVNAAFIRLTGPTSAYLRRQVVFDSIDTPNVFNIGCTLDSNRHDN